MRTRRERPATSKKYLHGCELVYIIIMNADAFKRDIHMVELGLRIMNESVAAGVGGSSP